MKKKQSVIVVGLGEVGRPILELVSEHHDAVGIDLAPLSEVVGRIDVMHVCYPFEIKDFIAETVRYIEKFKPELTVVNSTVAIGTTREIARRAGTAVVNSPVRGKHARMLQDIKKYTKFVGSLTREEGGMAAAHFQSVGLKTRVLSAPEATELAKLTETSYFGLMIAWAQEVERYCDRLGQRYEEVISFYDEIGFFPSVKYFPGIIGGHCVMPNIEILSKLGHSEILKAIQSSNRQKLEREAQVAEKSKAETLFSS